MVRVVVAVELLLPVLLVLPVLLLLLLRRIAVCGDVLHIQTQRRPSYGDGSRCPRSGDCLTLLLLLLPVVAAGIVGSSSSSSSSSSSWQPWPHLCRIPLIKGMFCIHATTELAWRQRFAQESSVRPFRNLRSLHSKHGPVYLYTRLVIFFSQTIP